VSLLKKEEEMKTWDLCCPINNKAKQLAENEVV